MLFIEGAKHRRCLSVSDGNACAFHFYFGVNFIGTFFLLRSLM